jgi:hypothetical protein
MTSIYRKIIISLAAFVFFAASAFAVTINGTVKNQSTGKPSSGDSVDLLALQQGMTVLASTKTDSAGAFHFDISDPGSPHLVRVNHDGVGYFPAEGPLRPGATSVSIDVYNAATKVQGVSTTVDILRLQTDSSNLQVMELFALKNASKPPQTLKGEKTYEFYLPAGAQIDQVLVQPPGGMPLNTSALQQGKTNRYAVNYAIKPGETRFEVAYHLPYSGNASFDPKMMGDVQHFLVMMPKSMTFAAKPGAKFSPMDDPNATVQVATNVTSATDLAFQVSGSGALKDDQDSAPQQRSQAPSSANTPGGASAGDESQSSGMPAGNGPGGGLGPPIDAPDPLEKYRWYILGGFALALTAGGTYIAKRSHTEAPPVAEVPSLPPSTGQKSMLLEALKEELFQLEIDRKQGQLTQEEYEKAKAALDQTLDRALKRKPV